MLTDFIARMQSALAAPVDAAGGIWAAATDRNEAITLGIKNLSARWMALIWITAGSGGEYQESIAGYCEVDYCVAICRRPLPTKDRSESALRPDDEKSLLSLWETVRGLIYRVRFGKVQPGTGEDEGSILFAPRDGYLDGEKPMQLLKFLIERQTYQIAEEGGTTKGMKELLWAETTWRVKLALPAFLDPDQDNRLDHHWLCA